MYLIGIDEVGRGPVAGPVVVAAVCVAADFDWRRLPGVNDSKKVSEKHREILFEKVLELQKTDEVRFACAKVSAPVIDRDGITAAVATAVARSLQKLSVPPHEVFVKLDGLLKAPAAYPHQETIVKGDQTEKEIALASIIAKVTRDRYMVRMSEKYKGYGFERHKGYGTKMHMDAIKKNTPCVLHRASFLR